MEQFLFQFYEENRKFKQNYLREEILEKGFDQELFSEYLNSIKEDGKNIDNWNIDELENLVVSFKRQIKEEEQNFQIKLNFEIEDIDLGNLNKKIYYKEIGCKKLNINNEQILPTSVVISAIKVENQGLFMTPVTKYTLNFPGVKKNVQRTVEQFKWLEKNLMKEFPFCVFPPLPQNVLKNELEKFSQDKFFLEKFLNFCLKDEMIQNSLVLNYFIKKQEIEKTKEKVEQILNQQCFLEENFTLNSYQKIKEDILRNYSTQTGFLQIKSSPQITEYFTTIQNQYKEQIELFEALQKFLLDYQLLLKNLQNFSLKIKNIFFELQSNLIKFNLNKPYKQIFHLTEPNLFKNFGEIFEQEEKYSKFKREKICTQLFQFSDYLKEYYKKINSLIYKRNFYYNQYSQNSSKLEKIKNQYIENKQIELSQELLKNTDFSEQMLQENPHLQKVFLIPQVQQKGNITHQKIWRYLCFYQLQFFSLNSKNRKKSSLRIIKFAFKFL